MALEIEEPDIVTLDEFTIAGLAHSGTPDDDYESLWMDFNDSVEDLADVTWSDEAYGVIYEYDQSDEEFTYVAGVEVDDVDDLAPELTAVAIPEGTYAVFETSMAEMESLLEQVTDEWSDDGEYERIEGPMFERYDDGYDRTDRDATFEFYVPVNEV